MSARLDAGGVVSLLVVTLNRFASFFAHICSRMHGMCFASNVCENKTVYQKLEAFHLLHMGIQFKRNVEKSDGPDSHQL